jgi:DNA-binding NarL/FixJ family response regulator
VISRSPAPIPERDIHPARLPQTSLLVGNHFVIDDRLHAYGESAAMRSALREAAVAAATAAARAYSLAEQLDEALAVMTDTEIATLRVPRRSDARQHWTDVLSPREREMLVLVADGRTNKAIAEALFVSPNTIKTHITSLLHKLQADTRVQLATIATMQGLQ